MNKDSHFRLATAIAHLLDDDFQILGFKFGLDPIIGLLPISGDLISLGAGLYIVWVGFIHGVPGEKVAQMIRNVLIDFGVGVIPIIGDLGDFVFKANMKNLEIIKNHRNEVKEGEFK